MTKNCDVCGEAFAPYRPTNRRCSVECRREGRAIWERQWAEANRDKQREAQRRYRQKNPDHGARWKAENVEAVRAKCRAWQARNREYDNARHSADFASKQKVSREWASIVGPWTPAEDAVALDPGLTRMQAAFLLRRTYSSVVARLAVLRKQERESAA